MCRNCYRVHYLNADRKAVTKVVVTNGDFHDLVLSTRVMRILHMVTIWFYECIEPINGRYIKCERSDWCKTIEKIDTKTECLTGLFFFP